MNIPIKLLCGLEPLRISDYEIQLQRGCAAESGGSPQVLFEYSNAYTIDIRVYGVGGKDYQGSLVSGWYYIWLIYNSTTQESAAIASQSELGGGVELPSGFDKMRKLNSFAFYYDVTTKIKRYVFQNWPSPTIIHTEADNGSGYRALLNGTQTDWTRIAMPADLVPPSARMVELQCVAEHDGTSGSHYVRTPGLGSGLLVATTSAYMTKQRQAFIKLAISSDLEIEYKVSPGCKLSLYVVGYSIQETY